MVIENKVVSYKHSLSGVELTRTWFELINACLESPPEKGFTSLSMMKKRMDLQTKFEPLLKVAPNVELTDKELAIMKEAVSVFPWAFNSKSLIEFIEFFETV